MALLHATQLFVGDVVTGPTTYATLYTVPAGNRIILRAFDMHNHDGGATMTVTVKVGGSVLLLKTLGIGADFEWKPWIVATPGQKIEARVSVPATGISCLVSGSIYTI